MSRAWCAFAVFAVCIGSSISADAAPPVHLGKAEVSPRVLRMHHAVLQLLPLIVKGGGPHDSTSTTNEALPCPGGGTLKATFSATTRSTGAMGAASYSVLFTGCKTTDDTVDGSMTFTYTASATSSGASNNITVSYSKANVILKSVSTDPIVLNTMTISTTATTTTSSGPSSPTTTNTASGTATVGGTTYTYVNDTLDTSKS